MGIHEKMAMKVLSNEAVAQGFVSLMFDVLMKGLRGKEGGGWAVSVNILNLFIFNRFFKFCNNYIKVRMFYGMDNSGFYFMGVIINI